MGLRDIGRDKLKEVVGVSAATPVSTGSIPHENLGSRSERE